MPKSNFDEPKLAELWKQYKTKPSDSLRAYLASVYEPIVKQQALPFLRKKPNVIDFDDLLQAGRLGLLDAIEKFDPSLGNKFQTYASLRVKGAILDSITALDWTPRSVRENIRSVLTTIESHYANDQSEPTVGAIAQRSGREADEVRLIMNQSTRTHMVQMEQEVLDAVGPTSDMEREELSIAIRVVMDTKLSVEERFFINLRLFQGYTNREIMLKMNLNASGLKSVKESAEAKLREGLKGYDTRG